MLELFRNKYTALIWLIESIVLLALFFIAAEIELSWVDMSIASRLAGEAIFAALVIQGSMYFAGLYADDALPSPRRHFDRFMKVIAIASAIILVLSWAGLFVELRPQMLLLGLGLSLVVLPFWRYAFQSISSDTRFARRALVLGHGDLARDITDLLRHRYVGVSLVGRLTARGTAIVEGSLGNYEDLVDVVSKHRVDIVIAADTESRGSMPFEQLLALKLNGIDIQEGARFYERHTGKVHVRSIRPSQLFFADGFASRPIARIAKRIFDLILSAFALVATSPIMALTAVAIRLESKGPVLYRQLRVGEHRREFWMLKFRSMRQDAEKDGARWASADDARVTRVGRLIRKTRLDELPQLWNVLRGDMSLVGPRPERPVFVEELERQIPLFSQRLYVRPGVTGHAQVRCQYAASVEDSVEKLQYDLYYIKRFSLLFDLSILLDTIKVVLLRIGSR